MLIAEHGRHRIVADIVADAYAPSEHLNSHVLIKAVVEENALWLEGGEDKGDVGAAWTGAEGRQPHIRVLLTQTDAAQLLTLLAIKTYMYRMVNTYMYGVVKTDKYRVVKTDKYRVVKTERYKVVKTYMY